MKNQSKKQGQGNVNSHSGISEARVKRKSRISMENVENRIASAGRAAYERAIKESRELFDLSLKIDDKVKAGVHEIHVRIGWYVGFLSFALLVAGWFGFPIISEWYAKRIEERITEKYVSTEVQKHLNDFTDTKVSEMISTNVSNVEERVKTEFTQYMETQASVFKCQAQELNRRVVEAESVINLYEKCASARSGNRVDYDYLDTLLDGTNRISHIAAATIEEIKKSYEKLKNTWGIGRVILINKFDKNKKISEDAMIQIVHYDSVGLCDGAINSLADKGNKKYTATLIYAVKNSRHLDFVYAAIRGVEKLTGQEFPALGIKETLDWWKSAETNKQYHCSFENYLEEPMLSNETADDFAWRKSNLLFNWIKEMPNQFLAASLIPPIAMFANVGADKEKEREQMLRFVLEYWEKENPKANNWYVFKTIYLARYDTGKIIDFVNQRLEEHPEFEDELRNWQFAFNPVFFKLVEINWPSKSTSKVVNEQNKKK